MGGRRKRIESPQLSPTVRWKPAWATQDPIIKYKSKLEWKEGREGAIKNRNSFFLLGCFIALVRWLLSVCPPVLQLEKKRVENGTGVAVYSCNPSTWELEADGLGLQVTLSYSVSSRPDSKQNRQRRDCLTFSAEQRGLEPSNSFARTA